MSSIIEVQTQLYPASIYAFPAEPHMHYRNTDQVLEYLHAYPAIGLFLQAAWPQLVKHFGDQLEVTLELLYFADEQTEPELVGWIHYAGDLETGVRKLDAFNESWFLDNMDEFSGRLNFNLEFQ
ncbi:MAG: hypothetical protein R3A44_31265 [Caldilineaceae bacterium]